MGLLQLFSLSFQNKLVAACVQKQKVPRIFVFPSNLHYTCSLCARVCLKHFGHCYDSVHPPFSVLVNTQVFEQLLIKCLGTASNDGHELFSFICQSQKSHCCNKRESKAKATIWIWARSFPEVTPALVGGGYNP